MTRAGEQAEVSAGLQNGCDGDLWALFHKTSSNLGVCCVWLNSQKWDPLAPHANVLALAQAHELQRASTTSLLNQLFKN